MGVSVQAEDTPTRCLGEKWGKTSETVRRAEQTFGPPPGLTLCEHASGTHEGARRATQVSGVDVASGDASGPSPHRPAHARRPRPRPPPAPRPALPGRPPRRPPCPSHRPPPLAPAPSLPLPATLPVPHPSPSQLPRAAPALVLAHLDQDPFSGNVPDVKNSQATLRCGETPVVAAHPGGHGRRAGRSVAA